MSTETDTAKTAQQDTSDNRPYAVILYGATSFVGQITAHYLTNFLSNAKNKDGSPDYRTQLKALELSSKILGVEQPKEVHMKIEPLNINMSFDKE